MIAVLSAEQPRSEVAEFARYEQILTVDHLMERNYLPMG